MQISHSEQINSTFETLWTLLLDKVHHPDKTIKEIIHVDILEKYDDGVLRQMQALGMIIKERITIEEAASTANLGKEAFCRYFRKMTRLSFIEFLNLYRVNQSKRMLRLGKSITEACYNSGFESLSYFNRVFKKQSGETPSAFRRRFLSI